MSNTRKFVIASLSALVVVSCAGDGAYMVGQEMADAGRQILGDALVEGGSVLQDAGMQARSDARADTHPNVVTVACNTRYQRRIEDRSGIIRIKTRYYAEIRNPMLRPTAYRGESALVCDADLQTAGMLDIDCTNYTTEGVTCAGSLGPSAPCQTQSVEVLQGSIRVFCGETSQSNYNGSTIGPLSPEYGTRYRSAIIVLP